MELRILHELDNISNLDYIYNNYNIYFCPKDDYEELIKFIDENWKKDHIFVKSKTLFDWQHYDKINNRYNFIIARNKATNIIDAILGFVPTYQYDSSIEICDIWPCIWQIREGIKVKGLGSSLYKYLSDNLNIRSICILGISEIALSLYKRWNFNSGKINQYYMVNKTKVSFNLIDNLDGRFFYESVEHKNILCKILVECSKKDLERIDDDFFSLKGVIPKKSKKYYINRFFNHPIYKYSAYKVLNDNSLEAMLFIREVKNIESKALRIVDFCGNIEAIEGMCEQIQKLMCDRDAEYIDFLNVGIEEKHFNSAGFIRKEINGEIIVPNYYEPFLLKNVDLDYAWKTIDECEPIFFKADADQDRPNIL